MLAGFATLKSFTKYCVIPVVGIAVVGESALPSGATPVGQVATDVDGRRHAVPWLEPSSRYRHVSAAATRVAGGCCTKKFLAAVEADRLLVSSTARTK